MEDDKDIIISKLNGKIGALQSQNAKLKQRMNKLKKIYKVVEIEELRNSLNNMTAIYGKLLRKNKRANKQ